jgi:hypothetical protein
MSANTTAPGSIVMHALYARVPDRRLNVVQRSAAVQPRRRARTPK